MKFVFAGDRGDLIGYGALAYGDEVELDQERGDALIARNFPLVPAPIWDAIDVAKDSPEHRRAAGVALHSYREELKAPKEVQHA